MGYSIGFTGTQQGMTQSQKDMVKYFLGFFAVSEVHHGDCVGADAEFHAIARSERLKVALHPPTNPAKRAFCEADEEFPKKDYLVRNREIVDNSDILIATPKTKKEEVRSGTWSTIRYAQKPNVRKDKRIIIIFPDGEVSSG
jgi:hypothetical protein